MYPAVSETYFERLRQRTVEALQRKRAFRETDSRKDSGLDYFSRQMAVATQMQTQDLVTIFSCDGHRSPSGNRFTGQYLMVALRTSDALPKFIEWVCQVNVRLLRIDPYLHMPMGIAMRPDVFEPFISRLDNPDSMPINLYPAIVIEFAQIGNGPRAINSDVHEKAWKALLDTFNTFYPLAQQGE